MAYWLCKQEPSTYNLESLEKEKKTTWDGVHNNLALKHLRQMKKGDLAFFYQWRPKADIWHDGNYI